MFFFHICLTLPVKTGWQNKTSCLRAVSQRCHVIITLSTIQTSQGERPNCASLFTALDKTKIQCPPIPIRPKTENLKSKKCSANTGEIAPRYIEISETREIQEVNVSMVVQLMFLWWHRDGSSDPWKALRQQHINDSVHCNVVLKGNLPSSLYKIHSTPSKCLPKQQNPK